MSQELKRVKINGTVGANVVAPGDVVGDPKRVWVQSTAEGYIDSEIEKVKNWVSNTPITNVVTVASLPQTGNVNTLYRVAGTNTYSEYGWDGTQFVKLDEKEYGIDDVPTAGSNNLVKSGGVAEELALGAIYDVSAKNPTAGPNNDGKWESLSALLSDVNLETLIPTSVRKGGMSIKFVRSSDNKYVQYRLMSTSFSTTENDWQGVDEVKSSSSLHEFAISDNNGNNIITLDDGHIKTKNFDSKNVKQDIEATEISVIWNLENYLQESGEIATTILKETQVTDYIPFENDLFIEGGFIRKAQHYILACAYDENKTKIASLYPTDYLKDLQARVSYDNLDNSEVWVFIDLTKFRFDSGHTASEVKYLRIQGTSTASPIVWKNYSAYQQLSPYKQSLIYGKNIAMFGGSFSVIAAGDVLRNMGRVKLGTDFFQTFGRGGAGFGWNSCWYTGYPDSPVLDADNHVQWEQSVPKQVEWLISWSKTNNVPIDYWILFFSTNDFNTHIKDKGSVDYTMADLEDTYPYSNRDTQDGGLIYCINRIYEEFPEAKILVWGSMPFFNARYGYDLTDTTKPTKTCMQIDGTSVSRTQQNTYAEFIDDQEAVCTKYHIPYLRSIDISQMNQFNYTQFYNSGDNYLHPLRSAYKIWSEYLIDFISKF